MRTITGTASATAALVLGLWWPGALALACLPAAPAGPSSRWPLVAAPVESPQSSAIGSAAPAWPCRLVIANDLRPSVELAWTHSPTFRAQCARLAEAGALVLLHRASSARIQRQAQSQIGVSADGTMVARVLVRLNADTVEHISHELEHILEHLDGVNFAVKASRNRSGVTLAGDAYETERAIEAGQRAAREVRAAAREPR